MVSMRKISLFLFFSFLCVAIVFIASNELFSQRGMSVTVRTKIGQEFDLYKNSYALIIGNGAYPVKNGWNPLPGAVKDVKEVAEVLERHGFSVTLKIDVTKSEFNQVFSEFIYESGKDPDNRLLFYYAGHGYTTKAATGEDLGYLVMLDTPSPTNAAKFDLYSVDMVKFVSDSKKIHAKHVLFMFDSCFSGTVLNLRNRVTPSHITDRIKNPVRQFITAGRADEPVPDRSEFKKAFLNILEGRVEEPTPDGYLTGVELGDYLYRTVPKFSQGQHPQHGKIHDQQLNTGDFVFVLPQDKQEVSEDTGIELNTIATLNITSTPEGAKVYIDGILIGTTPLRSYQVDTGVRLEKQVNVGLELSGYKSRVKKIILKGGQQFPWDVPLEKMVTQPVLPKSKSDVSETIVENDVGANEAEETTKEPVPLKPELSVPETTVEEDVNTNAERQLLFPDVPQRIVGRDGVEMVLIPAGDFQMGSGPGALYNSATTPVHAVYVDAFYIDKYEVTVGQYNEFVRATGHRPLPDWVSEYSPTDQHPVVGVSWHDAIAYAEWAGKRLPTEAEWEKAARGGLVGKNHPWGNAELDGTQCNFADKSLSEVWNIERKPEDNWTDKNIDDGYVYTAPVGSYPPNGYGLYDMGGNVTEWCFDAYDENFYANSPRRNPIADILIRDGQNNIVAINKSRVVRGGSWYYAPWSVWIASRLGVDPKGKTFVRGFRCVKSVKP